MSKDCYCEENKWQDICQHNHATSKRVNNGNCGCPCKSKLLKEEK